MKILAILGATFVFAGCPKSEIPLPLVDHDGLGTDLGEACLNLREVHCPEGSDLRAGRTCYEHLVDVSATVTIPSACVRLARTQEAVRACGDKSTLRFRCIVVQDAGTDGGHP